jgi:hypothetical protein
VKLGGAMEEGWSKERLRLLTVILDCIDEMRDELERATGQQAELIAEIIRRLESGISVIQRELAHPFLGRDTIPPSRVLH